MHCPPTRGVIPCLHLYSGSSWLWLAGGHCGSLLVLAAGVFPLVPNHQSQGWQGHGVCSWSELSEWWRRGTGLNSESSPRQSTVSKGKGSPPQLWTDRTYCHQGLRLQLPSWLGPREPRSLLEPWATPLLHTGPRGQGVKDRSSCPAESSLRGYWPLPAAQESESPRRCSGWAERRASGHVSAPEPRGSLLPFCGEGVWLNSVKYDKIIHSEPSKVVC